MIVLNEQGREPRLSVTLGVITLEEKAAGIVEDLGF